MSTPPLTPQRPVNDDVVLVPGPSRTRRAIRSATEWVLIIGGALLVAFLVKTFLIQVFWIPSDSMLPTLERGDRVVVNKVSYDLHEVRRGDLVVFERPPCSGPDEQMKDLIKRVIAVEGERVEGRNGRVFVDGQALSEPYLPAGTTTTDFAAVEVPSDHVWLMGDNRANSRDSRVLCGGPTPIAEERIIGRAFVRIWPFGRLGRL